MENFVGAPIPVVPPAGGDPPFPPPPVVPLAGGHPPFPPPPVVPPAFNAKNAWDEAGDWFNEAGDWWDEEVGEEWWNFDAFEDEANNGGGGAEAAGGEGVEAAGGEGVKAAGGEGADAAGVRSRYRRRRGSRGR